VRWNGLREYKFYIDDIEQSITRIQEYTAGLSKEEFKNDSKTYDSVLHNLMIIGEAAGKLPEEIRDRNSDINWSGIIGMRNIIAHGYFNIDQDIIWLTIKKRLPELIAQIKSLY
jgi:uncharacterized protein with HEPN domain